MPSPFTCDPVENLDGLVEKFHRLFLPQGEQVHSPPSWGVHRCVHGQDIDSSTAVFLALENRNLGDTENVLHQIYRENSFPSPAFNFINTMSNTASFYVARA